MISASVAVQNTIKQAIAAMASPRIIAEWNQNRYQVVATVDNWGSSNEDTNAFDPDIFPIASIVEPLRPTAGILIAKTTEALATKGFSDAPGAYRTYTASAAAKYKYWTSQVPASASGSGGSYPIATSGASPYVLYQSQVWTNKIYLCFETSWAKPKTYNVDVTTNGTTWTTVATNIVPATDGTVTLYRQSSGSWSTTINRDNPTQLLGVRVVVSAMTVASSFLNLIEMGLRLEQDLSPYLVSYSVDQEISDDDIVSPLGEASSNSGSVSLSNLDGRFNNDAPAGTDATPWYRGLIDANVGITIDLGIDSSAYGGSTYEYVRQATMFGDIWSVDDTSASVTIKDGAKFLQDINPLSSYIPNVTVGGAIWRILDSVGFNSYVYAPSATSKSTQIDYFWVDGTQTVWQIIQDVCRVTQTAAYFDVFGNLQIKTRDDAFNGLNTPVWTLDDNLNGTKQPDISTVSESAAFQVNKATVRYTTVAPGVGPTNRPVQSILWQAPDPTVLRSSALRYDMDSTQMHFWIDPDKADYWPYTGMVNIRGELIKYDGKEYRYVDKSGQWQTKNIHNIDDKNNVDNKLSSGTLGWKNSCSGKLIITERGYDWTFPKSHDTSIQAWINAGPKKSDLAGLNTVWTGGLHHIADQSLMRVQTNSSFGDGTFYYAPHGTRFGQPSSNVGTRFRINPGGQNDHAGIFWYANNNLDTMYILDIVTTGSLSQAGARSIRNEVRLLKRVGNTVTSISGAGVSHIIVKDIWYDLDVSIQGNIFGVFINGIKVLDASDGSAIPSTDLLGLYVRGNTTVDFEYFYHASNAGWPAYEGDESSYLDLIRGGYYSDQFFKDGYYRTREAKRRHGKRTITYKQRYANRFFDEFGILVHEVRPFSVKFDTIPALWSETLISNLDQVVLVEYTATPFGADFIIANASRGDVTIAGQDVTTVNRQTMIYGRVLVPQEEKTVERSSAEDIAARGEIAIDVSSPWIQNEGAATDLADWIVTQWAVPADQFDIEVFGNPLLELTDVVSVNYAPRNMTSATHRYFVTKVSHDYSDGGLGTTVTLRRAN